MAYLYNIIFYRPVLNALVFFYNTAAIHDFGLAIIFTTLLLRLILAPFFHKGAHQNAMMQRIQPKLQKIQETHKNDREKQTKAMMELYKEHGVNPFSGILLLIIQLPILLSLYSIIRSGIGAPQFAMLYSFVAQPGVVTHSLLGLINLQNKNIFMVVLAAIAQYFQARLAIWRNPNSSTPSQAEKMARQMSFVAPLVTIAVFYGFPAAVSLYWIVSSLFSIGQQLIVNHRLRGVSFP